MSVPNLKDTKINDDYHNHFISGNLAYQKVAWQSSVFVGDNVTRYASNAVDGRLSDGDDEYRECAETQIDDHDSWWMVDLGQLHTVYNVSIAVPYNCELFTE